MNRQDIEPESATMTVNDVSPLPATVPILVVGSGPVGMSLAMELGRRGLPVLVLEKRGLFETPEAKCNHVSARTMEIFRSFGIAQTVREAGLPEDYPHDVVYATSFAGYEMARLRIPPISSRFRDDGYGDGGWPTPEPPHRINQTFLEPILMRHVLTFPSIDLRGHHEVLSLEEDAGGVTVEGRNLETGEAFRLRAGFVVGCDGTRSTVRKGLGVNFEGDDGLMASSMATIVAPQLAEKAGYGRAWMHWILNPQQTGNIIALDGKDRYIVNLFRPSSASEDTVDFDKGLRVLLGTDVPVEIVNRTSYVGRRLLATSFGTKRMFIAGDAAHNWLPMAGYAMNAGIADAVNIGWKLAAVLQGWAKPALLASYDLERRPILDQVSRHIARIRKNQEFQLPPELLDPGSVGWLARERIGRFMMETDSQQFACKGINFGYYYDSSAAIAYDGETPPGYTLSAYTPSTAPGSRAPHLWLKPGVSLYDRLGPGFTLLCFEAGIDIGPLVAAAARQGVPLDHLSVDRAPGTEIYRHALVLVRADQHVVWRGDALPDNPAALFDRLLGTLPAVAMQEDTTAARRAVDAERKIAV